MLPSPAVSLLCHAQHTGDAILHCCRPRLGPSLLQAPLLRTCYRRTAFQQASNNLVRISLDNHLEMVTEAGGPAGAGVPRAPEDWCRRGAATATAASAAAADGIFS